jgi:hypothetical protein
MVSKVATGSAQVSGRVFAASLTDSDTRGGYTACYDGVRVTTSTGEVLCTECRIEERVPSTQVRLGLRGISCNTRYAMQTKRSVRYPP